MVYCSGVDCVNDSSRSKDGGEKSEKISFYRLPSDKRIRKLWIDTIKRPKSNLPPYASIRLCHLHFDKNCFERDLKSELLNLPIKRILKKDAVPTIFIYSKNNTQKRTSKVSTRGKPTSFVNEIEVSTFESTSAERHIASVGEYQVYDDYSGEGCTRHCDVGIQTQVQYCDNFTQTEETEPYYEDIDDLE